MFLVWMMWLMVGVARGENTPTITVHKECGPVPWQAYQLKQYGVIKDKSQDVAVGGKYNPLTQTMEADVGVKNGSHLEANGQTYELPIKGEQWETMYYVYMNCVTMSLSGIDVQSMWDDVLREKVLKRPEDLIAFMCEIKTLTDPSSGERWKQVKELLEEQGKFTTELATERQRIDGLMGLIKGLQDEVKKLTDKDILIEERLAVLERARQEEIARNGSVSVTLQEKITELSVRTEQIEAAVEQVQELIEERVVTAVTDSIVEETTAP